RAALGRKRQLGVRSSTGRGQGSSSFGGVFWAGVGVATTEATNFCRKCHEVLAYSERRMYFSNRSVLRASSGEADFRRRSRKRVSESVRSRTWSCCSDLCRSGDAVSSGPQN